MFKRTILSIAALTLAGSAFATQPSNHGCNNRCGDNNGDTINNSYNQPQGGTGIGVGVGVGIAGANSTVNSDIRNNNSVANTNLVNTSIRNENTNVLGQQQSNEQAQAQRQGQQQSNSQGQQALATSEGGAGGSGSAVATGNGTGNSTVTKVAVDASTRVERSAPSVGVGNTTQPIIDCRRAISIGGSNSNGSVVGNGIPLWKEGDCSGMMGIDAMSKSPEGTFSKEDYRTVGCTIEVLSKTKTCKKHDEEQRVEQLLDRDMTKKQLALLP